jgi:hypothetical protein
MHRRIFGGLMLAASLMIAAPTMALAATPAPTPVAATAAPPLATPLTVPLIGTDGTNAVATITSFQVVDGVLTAVGTVTGDVVTTVGGLAIPVENAAFTAPVTSLAQGASCQILQLDLGAIHLDLLGLVVDLAPVHLLIQAVPGAGNLLGNLLCAVVHLLDNPSTSLAGIVNLLNRILMAL